MLSPWEIPKLFHLVQDASRKVLGEREKVREADGLPIHNQQRLLVRREEHFKLWFNRSSASVCPVANPAQTRWRGSTNSPSQVEIHEDI